MFSFLVAFKVNDITIFFCQEALKSWSHVCHHSSFSSPCTRLLRSVELIFKMCQVCSFCSHCPHSFRPIPFFCFSRLLDSVNPSFFQALYSVHINSSFMFPKSSCHHPWTQMKLVISFSLQRCHPSPSPLRPPSQFLKHTHCWPPLSCALRMLPTLQNPFPMSLSPWNLSNFSQWVVPPSSLEPVKPFESLLWLWSFAF